MSQDHDRAFAGYGASAARWFALQDGWWRGHYIEAVDQIVHFLADDGIAVEGAKVLDLGCGDGIISLGLLRRAGAASVVGIDLVEVDLPFLDQLARANDQAQVGASDRVLFLTSKPDSIPVPDASVDLVVAWSVFEHVSAPTALFTEVTIQVVGMGFQGSPVIALRSA